MLDSKWFRPSRKSRRNIEIGNTVYNVASYTRKVLITAKLFTPRISWSNFWGEGFTAFSYEK